MSIESPAAAAPGKDLDPKITAAIEEYDAEEEFDEIFFLTNETGVYKPTAEVREIYKHALTEALNKGTNKKIADFLENVPEIRKGAIDEATTAECINTFIKQNGVNGIDSKLEEVFTNIEALPLTHREKTLRNLLDTYVTTSGRVIADMNETARAQFESQLSEDLRKKVAANIERMVDDNAHGM